ncbi:recombinase family protein [Paenibacillus dokdonensis]|uniref:Recombinase family protein n=1 Tax=Paenibacillus dokdonensis TaxID=2567944 RepID=A0ABU6GV35_9BACL|nr:recombinase family protein [Paenibacillus dokdonensis]MEC0243601.1 recombinase family protein [Paenibacillus dokdonensis]
MESLFTITEQFETGTAIGKFALPMLGATAQLEREQISQNVQLGVQRRNQLGKWNSGSQVLGYRWIPHPRDPRQSCLEIIPEEAHLFDPFLRCTLMISV